MWTLGQLVASTGYVVEPYRKYPTLLEVLLNFLKTEQNQGTRREVGSMGTWSLETSLSERREKAVEWTGSASFSMLLVWLAAGDDWGLRNMKGVSVQPVITRWCDKHCVSPLSDQAIRVLGLLGALDPYKHKVNIGMIDQSRDASAVSLSESKSSQDSCKSGEPRESCQV